MIEARKKEVEDAYRDAAHLIAEDRAGLPYAAVIVDEAQDMGRRHSDCCAPGAGGAERPVHRRRRSPAHLQPEQGGAVEMWHRHPGPLRKLRINYRTTEEIRNVAVALLEGCAVDDLDGGADDQRNYKSLTDGHPPTRAHCASAADQAVAIVRRIREALDQQVPAAAICIVARTHHELEDLERRLREHGVIGQTLQTEQAESVAPDAVRLATMHRVKGLEFDIVMVASVNDDLVPLPVAVDTADPVERATSELEERSLLYVALTRARKQAYLFSYGKPSGFLTAIGHFDA